MLGTSRGQMKVTSSEIPISRNTPGAYHRKLNVFVHIYSLSPCKLLGMKLFTKVEHQTSFLVCTTWVLLTIILGEKSTAIAYPIKHRLVISFCTLIIPLLQPFSRSFLIVRNYWILFSLCVPLIPSFSSVHVQHCGSCQLHGCRIQHHSWPGGHMPYQQPDFQLQPGHVAGILWQSFA